MAPENPQNVRLNLIRRRALAKLMSVSEWTLIRWEKKGLGPRPLRIGGTVLYRLAEVEKWIN